jgi:phosphatidylinositol-bisphosphatase
LQRLYNQKFIDEIKQKSLDIILYHKYYRRDTMLKNKEITELHISIASWNVNATDPEKMTQLDKIIAACEGADLVIFGAQEMIELSTNNVVTNNEEESSVSVKWGKTLEKLLNAQPDKKIFVQKVEMVGLMIIMFVSDKWKHAIKSVQRDTVKTGMGGQFGNKGGVVIRIKLFETSLCFVCAHLSAGYSKSNERIDDFVQIHKKSFQQSKSGVQN